MNRASVTSSNVVSVGYDGALKLLEVEFKSGTYRYNGVPPRTYAELTEAESVGGFIAANIKKVFPYVKVTDENPEPEFCEGCANPATTTDTEGVSLCQACLDACKE